VAQYFVNYMFNVIDMNIFCMGAPIALRNELIQLMLHYSSSEHRLDNGLC
jgi:hypothetical protein